MCTGDARLRGSVTDTRPDDVSQRVEVPGGSRTLPAGPTTGALRGDHIDDACAHRAGARAFPGVAASSALRFGAATPHRLQ